MAAISPVALGKKVGRATLSASITRRYSAAGTPPPGRGPVRPARDGTTAPQGGRPRRRAARSLAAGPGAGTRAGTLRAMLRSGGDAATGGSPPAPPPAFALVGVRVLDG